jgi:hypothetical protein
MPANTVFDVRTFGAVMSTGINCGQVRGPVQLSYWSPLTQGRGSKQHASYKLRDNRRRPSRRGVDRNCWNICIILSP